MPCFRSALQWSARVLLALLLGLITWQSLQPPPPMIGPDGVDKVVHFLAYAAVAALCVFGGARVWAAILFATLWGAGVEIAQGLGTHGRTPSMLDSVANFAGATVSAPLAARMFCAFGAGFSARV